MFMSYMKWLALECSVIEFDMVCRLYIDTDMWWYRALCFLAQTRIVQMSTYFLLKNNPNCSLAVQN